MRPSIEDLLSYEIRKEIAGRYFGFRKLIEDDIRNYDNQILESSLRLEQKIGYDLVRLYILLKDEDLIHDFFAIAGLEQLIFFDPYLMESPTLRKKVFAGQEVYGLTKAGRFKNIVKDTYQALADHIDDYRGSLTKLHMEQETIVEEIKLFYKKNDLGMIMGFLRGLEGNSVFSSGNMEGGHTPQTGEGLEEKMRVNPPPPVKELLPSIAPIAPYNQIKKQLKIIIERAFRLQHNLDWREITRP